jgi:N-acetylneuraminic acid mutarotase
VESYDPVTDTWTKKADMPTARGGLSASVVDGRIYAIGGSSSYGYPVYLSTVEMFDPTTNTWTRKADMPITADGLSTSVVNGIIYAIGGYGSRGWSRPVQAYDPATDTWTTKKADMPTARWVLSTSAVNGIIYAIGGAFDSGAPDNEHSLSTVEAYDPMTDTWTKKADMPTARSDLSTCVVNGIIYAIGGMNRAGWYNFSTVEAYDPVTDTWTKMPDMSIEREALSTSAVNGRIYVIGGWENPYPPGVLSAVEEYNWLLAPGRPPQAVDAKGKLFTLWGRLRTTN